MVDETVNIRPLAAGDLDALVALDKAQGGVSRRGFFEKRSQANAQKPDEFISLVAEADGALRGFVTGYILDGEFGGHAPIAVVDAISLDADYEGQGIGAALLRELEKEAKKREAEELRTQVDWGQMNLLNFFHQQGFALASRQVLERDPAGAQF